MTLKEEVQAKVTELEDDIKVYEQWKHLELVDMLTEELDLFKRILDNLKDGD